MITHKPDDITIEDWLPEAIDKLQSIVNRREDLEEAAAEVDHKWKTEKDAITKGLEELHNDCPHWITTYYGDPSGGSDSYDFCEICRSTND